MKNFFKKFYLGIILVFLYVPIVVLICQSFNAGKSRAKWEGFSFRWYGELFQNASIMNALWVTVSIAVIATVIATVLGTLAAIGIYSMKKRPQAVMMTITNLPNTMPDIVTGISLMLLFIFAKVDRGYFTMVLAHITFDVPYVVLSVMPKLKQMNKHTYEAALDLGATPGYALTHVIVPECRQGIVTGALLAFTLSLDDFVISFFVYGAGEGTLPLKIYSSVKVGVSPRVNALCSLMIAAVFLAVGVQRYGQAVRKAREKKAAAN